MTEKARLIITHVGLAVQFMSIADKSNFIKAMEQQGLYLFKNELGYICSIKSYTSEYPFGFFLSHENRAAILFPSEQLKYFFKEYIHLESKAFMDMGPGYEAQMHLNSDFKDI